MRLKTLPAILCLACLAACSTRPQPAVPRAQTGTQIPRQTTATSTPPAGSKLAALMNRAWQQEMRNNPMEASLDGDHRYDDLWGNPSRSQQQHEIKEMQTNLAALRKIGRNRLSPENQLDYRLFKFQLEDDLAGARMPDSDQGLITQLWGPQLMAGGIKQLRFDTLADYKHWLQRLQRFGTYLDAFTQRLRYDVAHGITQPRVVMKRVPGEIRGAISKNPEKSAFYAPFRNMPSTIPAAEQKTLRARAGTAIAEVVNPAYERFLRFFENEYLPHARKQIGVSSLPEGKAYYAYLVRHFTTTDMTPEQVHRLGLRQVVRIRKEMETMFRKIGFQGSYRQFLHHLRSDPRFYYKDPKKLLEAYRAATKRVDPDLVKIASVWILPRVPYGVRPIPMPLAKSTYPAYSVPPPGDDSVAGYVGVNLYKPQSRPKYDIQVLMCHEGRPGHQLQIPVAARLTGLPAFRRFAYYNAYGEGWALYAETLCNQLGLYDNPYSKFGYLDYQMWRAVRLVVDTGIHYYGWSREKAVHYMQDNTALSDQNIQTEVDRYIVWPGQALSYMTGELHILKLRKEATEKLGDKYSLRDFDDVVLGEGSLPMAVLSDVVQRWIKRTQAGDPADELPYSNKPHTLQPASGATTTMTTETSADPAAAATASPAHTRQPDSGSARPPTFGIARAELTDPTTLTVYYGQPYAPCYGKLGKVEVAETPDRVTITLHKVPPQSNSGHQMCSHMIMLKPVKVHLKAPLDDREVIDGSNGKTVKVRH